MRALQWVVPLALGLLVAGGGLVWHQQAGRDEAAAGRSPHEAPVFVLLPHKDAPAGPMALLQHPSAAVVWSGHYADGTFTRTAIPRCGDVASSSSAAVDCAAADILHPDAVSRPAEPGFGQDGQWLVRATILVFTSDGHLVFGNVDDKTRSLYPTRDYTPVPSGTFYLGNGTAPTFAYVPSSKVQELFEPLRAQLVGLPVGAVASAQLDSRTVRDLYGNPLYATARIEWLGVP